MTQTNAAQRAEAARLLADVGKGHGDYWDEQRLLELLPALLADAGALAERERADEVRRAGRRVIAQERETLAILEGVGD